MDSVAIVLLDIAVEAFGWPIHAWFVADPSAERVASQHGLADPRTFAGEIATAGCAMIFPFNDVRFMRICGNGTLPVIGLYADA